MLGNSSNSNTKADNFWRHTTNKLSTDDPLLGCLVILTRFEHKPFTAEALTAGLPLVDHKLTPELFVRAAKRADLSSQVVKRDLRNISPLVLPVVLLLKNNSACILVGRKSKDTLQIVQPESGAGITEVKLKYLQQEYTGYAIFAKPKYYYDQRTGATRKKLNPKNWLWSVLRKLTTVYAEVIVASLLVNLFALATPLFVMNVYDRVVPNRETISTLWVLAVGLGFVYIFDFIMKSLRAYFVDFAAKKADVLLSSAIYEQMIGLRMEARPESVGAFANNISQFEAFREFLTSTTILLLIDLPFIFLFIGVIGYIGGNLFWIPIIAIPIVVIINLLIQWPLNNLIKQSYRYSAQKQTQLIETLIGVEAIKQIGAEGPMQRKWESLVGISAKQQNKIKVLNALSTYLTGLVQQLAGISIIIAGVYHIHAGLMTMGGLIACNMLNSRCLAPLGQIALVFTRYEQSMTALSAVDKVMQMPVERPVGHTPLYREKIKGYFSLNDISLNYPKQELPAINELVLCVIKIKLLFFIY